ncbi:hypothetical protein DXU07_18455 [Bradyrhizobium elkanii]
MLNEIMVPACLFLGRCASASGRLSRPCQSCEFGAVAGYPEQSDRSRNPVGPPSRTGAETKNIAIGNFTPSKAQRPRRTPILKVGDARSRRRAF